MGSGGGGVLWIRASVPVLYLFTSFDYSTSLAFSPGPRPPAVESLASWHFGIWAFWYSVERGTFEEDASGRLFGVEAG